MDEGDRSAVSRSFMTNAWPPERSYFKGTRISEDLPITFADPGRTNEVVTPPAIDSKYDSS